MNSVTSDKKKSRSDKRSDKRTDKRIESPISENSIHKGSNKDKRSDKKFDKKFGKKFCPNCGSILKGEQEVCKSCSNQDFTFKDIHIVLCNSCHSYYSRNKWIKFKDINSLIKTIAGQNIKARVHIKNMPKELKDKIISYKAGIKTNITIPVTYGHNEFEIPATLEITLCNKCSKKESQYFESILQLRNSNDEILEFVRNDVKKQHKKGIYITKEVLLEKYSNRDIDLYLTNQTYAKTLAGKIKKNFGGIIKKNAKHFSLNWQTTKTVYRLNILLQLPNYKKNDVIKYDNHLYKVVSLGSTIHVIDLKTNNKTSLPNKDSYDVLHPAIFQVIKRYPEYEVLDPNTYYQARLMNPSKKLEINQKIKVVIDGSEAWMV